MADELTDLYDTADAYEVIAEAYRRLCGRPELPVVRKAVCYIVRDGRLLVFRHIGGDPDEVGLQVPAGTLRAGEDPAVGALREAIEETGLPGLRVVRYLGTADFDARPYRDELHRRSFFHLAVDGDVPERWRSAENHDGVGEPTPFECRWIPLRQGHVLQAAQSSGLGWLGQA